MFHEFSKFLQSYEIVNDFSIVPSNTVFREYRKIREFLDPRCKHRIFLCDIYICKERE